MLNLVISAVSSNSGKTVFTTALLYYFKNKVQPFKIGPDFIDPQFHKAITNRYSINLDSFIMDKEQVKWLFDRYKKEVNIIEGVMGFYDGEDRGCSAYSISNLLEIPTILLLDGSGSYITISAVLKGMLDYKQNNIKAVVLNKISSSFHFELIKKQLQKDHPDIVILGWIKKNLQSLQNRHLGLDLDSLDKIESISKEVLKNIDLTALYKLETRNYTLDIKQYPFEKLPKQNRYLAVVYDKNFSFLYYDNLQFFKEIFTKVTLIDSTKDEIIPKDCDIVYICGGYVETQNSYNNIKNSLNFKNSLIKHAKYKPVYAECAGLLYLSNKVDDKKMSGILDIDFILLDKRVRLGYYYNCKGLRGHAFHYTKPLEVKDGFCILSKKQNSKGEVASWKKNKVYGTYFHTMFRNNICLIKDYF